MDPQQEELLLKLLEVATKLDADVTVFAEQATSILAAFSSLDFTKFTAAYPVLWVILIATLATLAEGTAALYQGYRRR